MSPEEREMVAQMLAGAHADVSKIDSSIIAPSSTLKRSEGLKEELKKVMAAGAIEQAKAAGVQPPQLIPDLHPIAVTAPRPEVPAPNQDPGQLEFDLNRSARYDEVVSAIDRLSEKIDRALAKIEQLPEKKKKIRGGDSLNEATDQKS